MIFLLSTEDSIIFTNNTYSYKSFFYNLTVSSVLYWVPDVHKAIRIGQN